MVSEKGHSANKFTWAAKPFIPYIMMVVRNFGCMVYCVHCLSWFEKAWL